jgi:hypothetical protein
MNPENLARLLVGPCPVRPETGVHAWLWKASIEAVKQGIIAAFGEVQFRSDIEEELAGCGREVSSQEIDDALRNSRAAAFSERPPAEKALKPVPFEPDLVVRVVQAERITEAMLSKRSPGRISLPMRAPRFYLRHLFHPGELVCVATGKQDALTAALESWTPDRLERAAFVVPSPMSALRGKRKNGGGMGIRTRDNTGSRRYLVVESDKGLGWDEQASILWHLAKHRLLVLVVHSGGKSLHGWFWVEGCTDEELEPFFTLARRLGADERLWWKEQLVRMPDGLRDGRTRQRVVYFDPAAIKKEVNHV